MQGMLQFWGGWGGVGWGGASHVPLHLQKSRCYGQEGGGVGWGGIITSLALRSHALPHIRHATLLCVLMHFHTYVMLRWLDLLLRSTCSWHAGAYVALCVLIRSCYASTCLGSYASIWFVVCWRHMLLWFHMLFFFFVYLAHTLHNMDTVVSL